MMLIDRLISAAQLWATENGRSLPRLATIVVNDGKLFERLSAGGSCTVATYERLMAYLRDPQNWQRGIPQGAGVLLGLHGSVDGASAEQPSSGKAGEISAEAVRA